MVPCSRGGRLWRGTEQVVSATHVFDVLQLHVSGKGQRVYVANFVGARPKKVAQSRDGVVLETRGRAQYFVPRPGINLLSILKNPMVGVPGSECWPGRALYGRSHHTHTPAQIWMSLLPIVLMTLMKNSMSEEDLKKAQEQSVFNTNSKDVPKTSDFFSAMARWSSGNPAKK